MCPPSWAPLYCMLVLLIYLIFDETFSHLLIQFHITAVMMKVFLELSDGPNFDIDSRFTSSLVGACSSLRYLPTYYVDVDINIDTEPTRIKTIQTARPYQTIQPAHSCPLHQLQYSNRGYEGNEWQAGWLAASFPSRVTSYILTCLLPYSTLPYSIW